MASMLYICGMEDLKYIDDDWVAELVEEALLYDGVEVDISWYKGAGWYDYYTSKRDKMERFDFLNRYFFSFKC